MATSRRRALLLDVLVAVLLGSACWFTAQAWHWMRTAGRATRNGARPFPTGTDGGFEVWWLPLPFVLLVAIGLALRRVRPRTAFVLVAAGTAGYLAVGAPYVPVLLAPMLTTYALATTLPPRTWSPWALLLLPMLTARYWSSPDLGLLEPQLYGSVVVGIAAITVPAMIGILRRSRQQSQRAERAEEVRRIAYEERLRVAREVHDVVGHSLSVISMQAGVALHVLERRPDQAAASLAAIRDTSRAGLAELRQTLAVFRDPDAPLSPEAGLERLDGLVAALRAAGRDVSVEDRRSATALPAAVDLAALRIVQESLTNVVRHTESATARVELTDDGSTLSVTVSDDGPAGPELEPGNGIAGIRERARAVGGSATVRRRPGGGVEVRTELPIGTETT